MNPLAWYRDHRRKKERDRYLAELDERWRKHVWEWHVPLQKESIAARGPFLRLCEEERANAQSGGIVDKQRLQKEFAILFEEMVAFDSKIVAEFVEWYHSDQGSEWRVLLEEEQIDQLFLANAGDILKGAASTTLRVCQYNSRDLIEADDLYVGRELDA